MSVRHFTIKHVATWYQHTDRQMFLGGVLDETNSDAMSVGFGRYQKGESNEWIVTYDEVNIVTKGAFTFRTADGAFTAKAGEVLFITKGTKVVYEAAEDTEFVYVTYPHWMDAQRKSEHAALLDTFHPV
ncbi:MAG: cupin [Gammaproteobacteria bacterium]